MKMMKKILVWLLAIMLCLGLVPSFAEEAEEEITLSPAAEELEGGEENLEGGPEEEEEEEPTIRDKAIRYSIESDEVLKFKVADFVQACSDETKNELKSIKINEITAGSGSLWHDYDGDNGDKVKIGTEYLRSSSSSTAKLISKISYVPKPTFEGEAEIYYTGYSTEKGLTFEGMIIVEVTMAEEKGDLEKINHYVDPGDKITFDASEINSLCRNAGFSLSYITFELPDAETEGVLYYDYKASKTSNTKVKATTKYYRDTEKSTLIDKVTLLVSEDAEENFTLTYYAYDADGEKYEGVMGIKVESSNNDYDIYYEVTGESVFFTPSDFNKVCLEETGTKLSYVKFSSPSEGSLYYDYDDEEGEKAKMSSSKKYYYGKSPYLYLMAYVPKTDYEGTVFVDYEGYSIDGDSYNGTVTIKVDTSSADQADDIKYSVKNTSYKTFSASSFTNACKEATGEALEYVKFTLPSSSQGTLYYKYSSGKDENEKVSSATKFYNSEADYIKYVSFVPKSGYKGTATISYTGYSEEGTRFTGKIKITVTGTTTVKDDDDEDAPDPINYKGEKGKAVKFDGDDFYDTCDEFWGDDLEYVVFTLPSATYGTLYYDYGGKDEEEVKKGYEYYYEDDDMLISDVSFVPERAGNITIKYTAVTVEEEDFTGTVVIKAEATDEGIENFKFQRMYNSGIFSDIDEDAWYGSKQSGVVKLAYRYGLMSGRADGTFDPSGSITVAEALTIAARVHDIYYNNETEFKAGSTWYEGYVNYAIEEGIIKKKDFTNYDRAITREEMAYIFANIIPEDALKEINDVEEIPDVDESNKYYYEILYLYNAGVLSGSDAYGTFNPKANISRAEVSAIIVRVVDPEERKENNF
ncbi:MAG: S-layer homology domain-containing protein [Clostridia bacterium]|nr:S-layer homology domain-containing protein [Clostridia bacterium]